MRILMTGSHGFVGTNLIEAFESTYHITRWNIMEDKPLPECDAVIHLAGLAHDTKHTTEKEKYFEVNTELTKRAFDRFLESRAKKFIFFSSIKAQDNDTPYAKSKKAAEEYIQEKLKILALQTTNGRAENGKFLRPSEQASRDDKKDKKIYILRPCMIHGKGVKGNLPLLFNFVKKGWPWPLAAFENQRSYASIGNVSFVVNELLKKDVESGIYNICDDESVSTNELICLINESLGIKPKMISIPKNIVRFGAKLGDTLHFPLNTERLGKLTENNVIDNCDIKKALGINLMPVKAMDGLKVSIRELMKND